ncbi:hypothetical protein BUALT_Bualt02G0197100 [Buddleja alternifolia]|uniref:Glutaredoxin domain-containing protein n=1 Tax=Buddleja alternifolia TaxID=168488 RepID=A0AAV6Y2V0_9LAMI|nr:hypothetical protein BUALT_Bualt02G0197100 [Buddleja alternifolia]
MAGTTTQLTIKSFNSVSLSTRSYPIRTQIPYVSCVPNRISTYFTSSSTALRCRNAGSVRIRAMCSNPSGSRLEDSVKKTISENPVVVYSKIWCPYSIEVKSLFKGLGVDPLAIELDQLGAEGVQLQKTLQKLTGQRTVPNVFIGGKHIGGCTDTVELHQRGELEPLLSEAGAKK